MMCLIILDEDVLFVDLERLTRYVVFSECVLCVIQFLPEDIFVSKPLSLVLLLLHVSTLIYLFCFSWLPTPKASTSSPIPATTTSMPNQKQVLSPTFICYTMLVSNWIGIVFARTLHYQFYVWYFHALPLFLWMNILTASKDRSMTGSVVAAFPCVLLWLMVEYAFNVFPATPMSSLLLQVAHVMILVGYIRLPHVLNIPMYATTTMTVTTAVPHIRGSKHHPPAAGTMDEVDHEKKQ